MSKFAWVTLTTNDTYSLGALVLAHSLRRAHTAHQLAVLITPGVSEAMRDKLRNVYDLVQEVDVMDSRDAANLALLARPELGITFTKLHCWRLVQYEKCVFLDSDTLVLQNSDELFEREELSAAPDVSWPDCFNSGVFVFKPSLDTFAKITQFAVENGSFDGGDQGLLNEYFADWAHKDISKHLPFIYNVTAYASYCYLPAFKQFKNKIKILHFAGKMKPWLIHFNTENKVVSTPTDYAHASDLIQLWWNIFCDNVHQNLTDNMSYWPAVVQWNFNDKNYQSSLYQATKCHHHHYHHYEHQNENKKIEHYHDTFHDYFANIKDFHDPWEDYYENLDKQNIAHNPLPTPTPSPTPPMPTVPIEEMRQVEITYDEQQQKQQQEQEQQHQQQQQQQQQQHKQLEEHLNECNLNREVTENALNWQKEQKVIDNTAIKSTNIAKEIVEKETQNYNINAKNINHEITATTATSTTTTTTSNTQNVNKRTKNCTICVQKCNCIEKNDNSEAGLAGALSHLRLGEQRTPEQEAYENLMRRQHWESGQIDYSGKDSFDNILKRISVTMEQKPTTTQSKDDKSGSS